jgi:hypothetical protein
VEAARLRKVFPAMLEGSPDAKLRSWVEERLNEGANYGLTEVLESEIFTDLYVCYDE